MPNQELSCSRLGVAFPNLTDFGCGALCRPTTKLVISGLRFSHSAVHRRNGPGYGDLSAKPSLRRERTAIYIQEEKSFVITECFTITSMYFNVKYI